MPRLLSDSESSPDNSQDSTTTQSMFDPSSSIFSTFLQSMTNYRLVTPMTVPMMPMILSQTEMQNMISNKSMMENINDPNKCFFFVMPISATDLKNNFFILNQNMRQNQSFFQSQNQNEIILPFTAETEKLVTSTNCKEQKISQSYKITEQKLKKENGLLILDKVPVLKLSRIDDTYRNSTKNSVLTKKNLNPIVNLERIDELINLEKNNWSATCCCCQVKFSSLASLKKHKNLKHPKISMFFCTECGKSFLLRKLLNMHVNKHRSFKILKPVVQTKQNQNSTDYYNQNKLCSKDKNLPSVTPKSRTTPRNFFSINVQSPEVAVAKKSKKVENSKCRRKSDRILNRLSNGNLNNSSPDSKMIVSVTKVVTLNEKSGNDINSKLDEVKKESPNVSKISEIDLNKPTMEDFEEVPSNDNENMIDIFSKKMLNETDKNKLKCVEETSENEQINDTNSEYIIISDNSDEDIENKKGSNNKHFSNITDIPLKRKNMKCKEEVMSKKMNKETSKLEAKNQLTKLCKNCRRIQNTVQNILNIVPAADQINVQIKCPVCPQYLTSTEDIQFHLSKLHWQCYNKKKCMTVITENSKIVKINSIMLNSKCDKKSVSKDFFEFHTESSYAPKNKKKEYTCKICSVRFDGNDDYYHHFLSNHIEEETPLEISREQFLKLRDLEGEKELVPCSVCKIKYSGKLDLSIHHQIAHLDHPNMCSVCGEAFKTKNEILEHIFNHDEKQARIVFYKRRENISKLLKTDNPISNEVTVDESLDSTKFDSNMPNMDTQPINSDLDIKQGSEPQRTDTIILKRKVDKFPVDNPKIIKMSEGINTICSICDKSFESEKLYNTHVYFDHDTTFDNSNIHKILMSQNIVDDNTKDAVNSVIKELLDSVSLNEDRTIDGTIKILPEKIVGIGSMIEELHESEKNNDLENEAKKCSEDLNKIVVDCKDCSESFATEEELKLHKFFVHSDQNLIHICENCGKVMGSVASVNEHLCSGSKTFFCEHCSVQFADALMLKQHNMEKHLEIEGSYTCFCGKEFLTYRMLMKHIKISHDEEMKEREDADMVLGPEMIHIIPIENKVMNQADRITELNKFINVKHYVKIHSLVDVNCSYPTSSIVARNYCPLCKTTIILKRGLQMNDHYVQKHWLQGEVCRLCGLMFQEIKEIQHIIDNHTVSAIQKQTNNNLKVIGMEEFALDFIRIMKPACLVSIYLYRLQRDSFKNLQQCKCIVCEEKFANGEDCQLHFLKTHDKICILCNKVFVCSFLAASHKKRKHDSLHAYLWFVNRATNYFASIIKFDDFFSHERYLCKLLTQSHEIAVTLEKGTKHLDDCKQYTDIDRVCSLMGDCIEDFGQIRSDCKQVLLVTNKDIVHYRDNIEQLAAKMIKKISQMTLDELTQLLTIYIQSLEENPLERERIFFNVFGILL